MVMMVVPAWCESNERYRLAHMSFKYESIRNKSDIYCTRVIQASSAIRNHGQPTLGAPSDFRPGSEPTDPGVDANELASAAGSLTVAGVSSGGSSAGIARNGSL